ncbi:hypothetical protein HHI36_010183 [Cryptolaemus montrouzieri]|uniref:Uncharacterized protein n=1 Tax=Cryptolaemus montrouzieri TaxID=559131 RepID=A0ABD2MHY1_9CUCU
MKQNIYRFVNRLDVMEWNTLIISGDAEKFSESFHTILIKFFNIAIPERKQKIIPKGNRVLDTPAISSLKSKVDPAHTIWMVFKHEPSLQVYEEFKLRYENNIDEEVRRKNYSFIVNCTNRNKAICQEFQLSNYLSTDMDKYLASVGTSTIGGGINHKKKLSELEQRVLEAEGRAEEAEDKVS